MDSVSSSAANVTTADVITANVTTANVTSANVTTANINGANITAIFTNFHLTEKFDHHLPMNWFSPYVKDIEDKLSTKYLKTAFKQSLGSSFGDDNNQFEHNNNNSNNENDDQTSSSGLAFPEIRCRYQTIQLRDGATVVRHGLSANLFYGFANLPMQNHVPFQNHVRYQITLTTSNCI